MNFSDPRMDPRFFMMQHQYHPPPQGYGAPPPSSQRKQGQDEEIAMNLLKLNKNNSEAAPGSAGDGDEGQASPGAPDGSVPPQSDEEMYRNSMHAQQQRHHAAFMHGGGPMHPGGMYPPMGSVYGYPGMGFDRSMLAAAVGRERGPPHAQSLMDEPPIGKKLG